MLSAAAPKDDDLHQALNEESPYYVDPKDIVDGTHPKFFKYLDENTIRLYLRDYRDSITDWSSLVGITLTLAAILVSGTYTNFLNLDPSFWKAFFFLAFIISLFRLLYALFIKIIKLRGKSETDIFIEKITNRK